MKIINEEEMWIIIGREENNGRDMWKEEGGGEEVDDIMKIFKEVVEIIDIDEIVGWERKIEVMKGFVKIGVVKVKIKKEEGGLIDSEGIFIKKKMKVDDEREEEEESNDEKIV